MLNIWKCQVNFVPDQLYGSGRKCWLVITESRWEEAGGSGLEGCVEFAGELL